MTSPADKFKQVSKTRGAPLKAILDQAWPVNIAPSFGALLQATDEADRKSRSAKGPRRTRQDADSSD